MPGTSISRLSEYLHQLGVFKYLSWPLRPGSNPDYTGVSFDSRTTRPGDLFVAYQGVRTDSHLFVPEALSRGAAGVCCEQSPHGPLEVPAIVVSSGRRALSAAAALLYDFPSRRLNVAGVTGTNGKTTTTFMVTRCLEAGGLHTGLVGTLAYKLNGELHPSHITTPDAPELQELLAKMVREGATHAAMEVSSHGLVQERVSDVCFDTAVITNISADHLDVHESFEDYLDAKARLFTGLKPGSLGIYNADDHFATAISRHSPVFGIGVGHGSAAHVRLEGGRLGFGPEVARAAGGSPGSIVLSLRVPGPHNVMNAALAATVAYLYGVPLDIIQRALTSFPGLPRRLQVVYDGDYRIIDDFAHNPGSLQAVFSTVASSPPQKTILVNALRGNRGEAVNSDNAKVIAHWAPRINTRMIITSLSKDVVRPKDVVTQEEFEAFMGPIERSGLPHTVHDRLESAIDQALREAKPGELVLLLGAQGMDPAGRFVEQARHRQTGASPAAVGQFELGSELGDAGGWASPGWQNEIRTALFDGAEECSTKNGSS